MKRQVDVDWEKWEKNNNKPGPLDYFMFWVFVGIFAVAGVISCAVGVK